ncbi:MAG: bifunctional 4-hydroxy-2-oxoglutarate aldolase/2-dehydro-3-deoxy-phosphogluconate aldolase [Lentisphaerae bacterium]|nr:MAG: bifunctional 4-hydroxy-2-oxoglutarate aldolase/2-dehydro-3-deoxy-phosphogluconate aldolase [Lentisphaerota bacterium]
MLDITEQIANCGVIPIGVVNTVDDGLRLCEALLAGGLNVIEITFRTEAAADTIAAIKQRFPDILLGAGTLIRVDDVRKAREAGAVFGVSPGLNPEVLQEAQRVGLEFFPGVCTPTDVEHALKYGAKILKFFPAEAAGGVKMLKALWGPYGHLGLSFCPTGGISGSNMSDYLKLPGVIAVGGSWLSSPKLFGEWSKITRLAQEAVQTASMIRSKGEG